MRLAGLLEAFSCICGGGSGNITDVDTVGKIFNVTDLCLGLARFSLCDNIANYLHVALTEEWT